jgi:hypothetical protein
MGNRPSTYTEKGIAAAKTGNLNLARQFLKAALAENPDDAQAWLWMSSVVHTATEKRDCLRRVLEIDPNNTAARRGLEILGPEPVSPVSHEPVGPSQSPFDTSLSSAPKPAAPAAGSARRPAAPQATRRRPRALWIVLLFAAIIVAVIAIVVLAGGGQSPTGAVSQPQATSVRPPTWTPEPTATPRPTPTPRPAPTQLQPLVEEAIRIRELEPNESIHYVLSAQFDLDLYLRNDLDSQSVVFANTFWEEMRALGLVGFEAEYDRQQLIDTTSRQLGGFYSASDKTLYAVTESSRIEPSEYALIVHEYTHALTDMHFDLERLYQFGQATTDADLAARALGEGDATLVENSSPWSNYGPRDWDVFSQDARWAAPLFRQAGVSPALLFINSFPYVEGWEFVWSLRAQGGWDAVNAAYADIPASTEHILHPDKYLAGDDPPREVKLPGIDVPSLADYELIVESDRLGEFVLSLLLEEFLEDAARAERAAAGWGGDALRAWSDRVGRQTYVLLTAWDGEEDAREFGAAAADMLAARAGSRPAAGSDLDRSFFEGEQGTAYLSRRADQVLIVWSPDAGLRDEILSAFPDF